MISLSVRTLVARGISRSSLLLIFNLPTGERSYLLGSKKRPLNRSFAALRVGGSPGLSFLYISISASDWLLTLSVKSVSRKEERYLTLSMYRRLKASTLRVRIL